MVRFIIFQQLHRKKSKSEIYIPIWLDLLFQLYEWKVIHSIYLHSNMVRFIINELEIIKKFATKIYIPIWLDLLCRRHCRKKSIHGNLHSNMVRFIIKLEIIADF